MLSAPKTPYWGCGHCGEATNWASRLRCRKCERGAPRTIADKARAAHRNKAAQQSSPSTRAQPQRGTVPKPKSTRSYAEVAASAATDMAALRAENAALKAAAAAGPAEARPPRRARRIARRVNFADTVPVAEFTKVVIEVIDDHADIEVEPAPPLWICPACTTEHD